MKKRSGWGHKVMNAEAMNEAEAMKAVPWGLNLYTLRSMQFGNGIVHAHCETFL